MKAVSATGCVVPTTKEILLNASRQHVLNPSLEGSSGPRTATPPEKTAAAKAWAEFLYEEFLREKRLHVAGDGEIIKKPTYHDKSNA